MHSPTFDGRHTRFVLTAFFVRQIMALAGFALLATISLGIAALATWNVADPSLSYATGNQPTNLLGYSGAIFADIVMQFLGLSAIISLLPVIAWAIALIAGRRFNRIPARIVAWIAGAIVCAASLGCFPAPVTWPLPNGIGGVIGDMILRFPALFIGAYPTGTIATVLGVIFAAPAAWLMLFAAGIVGGLDDELEREDTAPVASKARAAREAEEDDEDDGEGFFAERSHLRPATDNLNLRVIFSGLSSYLVATGRLIDERRDHQKVYAFQVLVRVDYTAPVFKPDFPLVQEFALPLG